MKLLRMFYRIRTRKRNKEVEIPYYEAWHDEIGKPKKVKKFDIPLPPVFLN